MSFARLGVIQTKSGAPAAVSAATMPVTPGYGCSTVAQFAAERTSLKYRKGLCFSAYRPELPVAKQGDGMPSM